MGFAWAKITAPLAALSAVLLKELFGVELEEKALDSFFVVAFTLVGIIGVLINPKKE